MIGTAKSEIYIRYDGRLISITEASEKTGIARSTIKSRYYAGTDLFRPVRSGDDTPMNTPAWLLDTLIDKMDLKNDDELAVSLHVVRSRISEIRNGRKIGSEMLIKMHDASGLEISALKSLAGLPVAVKVAEGVKWTK